MILEKHVPSDHILAVRLSLCPLSLRLLQNLNNLIHLEIQECDLHGKLDALRHMHRGLTYLKMYQYYDLVWGGGYSSPYSSRTKRI